VDVSNGCLLLLQCFRCYRQVADHIPKEGKGGSAVHRLLSASLRSLILFCGLGYLDYESLPNNEQLIQIRGLGIFGLRISWWTIDPNPVSILFSARCICRRQWVSPITTLKRHCSLTKVINTYKQSSHYPNKNWCSKSAWG